MILKLSAVCLDGGLEQSVFDSWLALLPFDRQTEICKKTKPAAELSLAGDLLARLLLSQTLNLPLRDIEFLYAASGKPDVRAADVFFSISHSGSLAAAVVCDCPCGLDVQRPVRYNPSVMRREFSGEDCEYLENLPTQSEKDAEFTRLWTRKESLLKALGCGFAEQSEELRRTPLSGHVSGCEFTHGQIGGYFAAVCEMKK